MAADYTSALRLVLGLLVLVRLASVTNGLLILVQVSSVKTCWHASMIGLGISHHVRRLFRHHCLLHLHHDYHMVLTIPFRFCSRPQVIELGCLSLRKRSSELFLRRTTATPKSGRQ
jgi:hypothetical protein